MEAPRIAILAPEVINQIAAGEVVERPSSVVKELVENALDAGAGRIDVQIAQGGTALVRVADDGRGMTAAEAALSLERHATSKLRVADDLLQIQTMGFRGEALPSIASVSRMTLVTRPRGADAGHQLRLEGGALISEGPVGTRTGTVVEVADLFFNTPARLKFLKSTATETAQVSDVVTQLALANPAIHLTLAVDGRRTQDLPPASSRLERTRAVIGRRAQELLVGRLEDTDQGLTVEVHVSPPRVSSRSARSVHALVNRRVVRHRALVHAVVAGYGDLLERGSFPLAVVYLDVAPAEVDVNVHPQKTEVRFSDPDRVLAVVRRCVSAAVGGELQLAPAAAPGGRTAPAAPAAPRIYRLAGGSSLGDDASSPSAGYVEHRERVLEATRRFWGARGRLDDRATEATARYASGGAEGGGAATDEAVPGRTGFFGSMRRLGIVLDRYLLLERPEGLVLVERRAARERVTLERLRSALGASQDGLATGPLPGPLPVELTADQDAVARRLGRSTLPRLGIEIEHFGGTTWTVRALPRLLAGADPAALARTTLDALVALPAEEAPTLDALEPALRGMARLVDGVEVDDRTLLEQLDGLGIGAARGDAAGEGVWLAIDGDELARRLRR